MRGGAAEHQKLLKVACSWCVNGSLFGGRDFQEISGSGTANGEKSRISLKPIKKINESVLKYVKTQAKR